MNLSNESKLPNYSELIEALAKDDKPRTDFLMACLLKLGLEVNPDNIAVPSLSRLHLSSVLPQGTSDILSALQEIITIDDGEEYIKDENDTFHLEKPSSWSLSTIAAALPDSEGKDTNHGAAEDRIIDYSTVVKRLVFHKEDLPTGKDTPYFNHQAYFANLKNYEPHLSDKKACFGRDLLYGEVVTSTNTMLEK